MIAKPRGKKKSYSVYLWVDGKKTYVGTRDSKAEALQLEARERIRAANRKASIGTVQEFSERWLNEPAFRVSSSTGKDRGPTTTRLHREQMKHIVRWFGAERLDSIKREEAMRFAHTHPHAHNVARAMWSDAINAELIDCRNPFSKLGIKKPRGRKDIIPLREDEVAALAKVAKKLFGAYGEMYGAFIIFQAYVGCRPSEAFAIEPGDIDTVNGFVRIDKQLRMDGIATTKNDENRTIVLPAEAHKAIAPFLDTPGELPVPYDPLVGPKTYDPIFRSINDKGLTKGSCGEYWRKVRGAWMMTLDGSHWLPKRIARNPKKQLALYECRHFCGSLLASRGLTAREISAHMGNSPEVAEEYYVHLYEDVTWARTREAFDRPEPKPLEVTEETEETRKAENA